MKPFFGISKLRIGWSDSRKKWPDIYCETGGIPRIVVTREWQRQNLHERRKRLVHEALHIARDLDHGIVEGYEYSTYPAKDTYSRIIYQRILKKPIPAGVRKLMNPNRVLLKEVETDVIAVAKRHPAVASIHGIGSYYTGKLRPGDIDFFIKLN